MRNDLIFSYHTLDHFAPNFIHIIVSGVVINVTCKRLQLCSSIGIERPCLTKLPEGRVVLGISFYHFQGMNFTLSLEGAGAVFA